MFKKLFFLAEPQEMRGKLATPRITDRFMWHWNSKKDVRATRNMEIQTARSPSARPTQWHKNSKLPILCSLGVTSSFKYKVLFLILYREKGIPGYRIANEYGKEPVLRWGRWSKQNIKDSNVIGYKPMFTLAGTSTKSTFWEQGGEEKDTIRTHVSTSPRSGMETRKQGSTFLPEHRETGRGSALWFQPSGYISCGWCG